MLSRADKMISRNNLHARIILQILRAVYGTEPPCHSHEEACPFVRGNRELVRSRRSTVVNHLSWLMYAATAAICDRVRLCAIRAIVAVGSTSTPARLDSLGKRDRRVIR